MKKIVITGSAGFVLGNFVRKALYDQGKRQQQDKQYTFVSIDKLIGDPKSIYANKSHQLYVADIANSHILDRIFQIERPNIVIHGADECNSSSMMSSNIIGTQNIIDACVKHKVEKLLYISTDKIYGNGNDGVLFTEDMLPNPSTSYAASKAAGELLVRAAHSEYGLSYNIARVASCYGPRQQPEKLIPMTIKAILSGSKIPLYRGGIDTRDWLHVADNCSALLTILEKGAAGTIYNVSSGQDFSSLEIVYEISKFMTKGQELIETANDPMKIRDSFRKSDNSKLKQLGWAPSIKLRDGLPQVAQWFCDNVWALQ